MQTALTLVAVARAHSDTPATTASLVHAVDVADTVKLVLLAVFVAAVTLAARRAGMLPRWMSGVAIALVVLLPLGGASFLVTNGLLAALLIVSLPVLLVWAGLVALVVGRRAHYQPGTCPSATVRAAPRDGAAHTVAQGHPPSPRALSPRPLAGGPLAAASALTPFSGAPYVSDPNDSTEVDEWSGHGRGRRGRHQALDRRRRVARAETFPDVSPIDAPPSRRSPRRRRRGRRRRGRREARPSPPGRRTPPEERAAILRRIADGVEKRIEELAQVETRDNGSLLRSHRRGVMPRVALNFRYFADHLLALGHDDWETRGHRNHVTWDPAGVTAIVTPGTRP